MKTQVLHLEPHDDVISICDKMGWGQTGRVLLVWPQEERGSQSPHARNTDGPYLERRLDLVLLQRRAAEIGAQLALVTHDPLIQAEARDQGLSYFESIRKAQNVRWHSPRRRKFRRRNASHPDWASWRQQVHPKRTSWLEHPVMRFGLILLAVAALLALVAAFVPSAQVRLTPAVIPQEITIPIRANPLAESFNLAGEVPARHVTVIVEGQGVLTTTGSVSVPVAQAVGTILFTNLTELAVGVPTGTIVTTEGDSPIRFATASGGAIPAGVGHSISLPVRAVQPGLSGNLPGGSIQAIEGPLSFQLTVTNPRPTAGGAEVSVAAPADADRIRLYNQLVASLRQKARQQLEAGLAPGDVLLTTSPVLSDTLQKIYLPDSALPAEQISLTLRLEFEASLVSGNDLRALATALLDASLPQGYSAPPGRLQEEEAAGPSYPVEIERLTEPKMEGASAHWQLRARRSLVAQIAPAEVSAICLGQPPAEALRQLQEQLPLARPAQIVLEPPWWPRLPLAPFRLTVLTVAP